MLHLAASPVLRVRAHQDEPSGQADVGELSLGWREIESPQSEDHAACRVGWIDWHSGFGGLHLCFCEACFARRCLAKRANIIAQHAFVRGGALRARHPATQKRSENGMQQGRIERPRTSGHHLMFGRLRRESAVPGERPPQQVTVFL